MKTKVVPHHTRHEMLISWSLTVLSAQIIYIVPQEYEMYNVGLGDRQHIHIIKQ